MDTESEIDEEQESIEDDTSTPWTYSLSAETTDEYNVNVIVLITSVIAGLGLIRFGYIVLQTEPASHWFEGIINLVVQLTGWGSLVLGVFLVLSPILSSYFEKDFLKFGTLKEEIKQNQTVKLKEEMKRITESISNKDERPK
tara:strand:- start:85 stop:510 length:426 start_codon:yes stop_codon:yes gene_type:complete